MDDQTLVMALEAVLFASAEPVPLARLEEVFQADGVEPSRVLESLGALKAECTTRGIDVQEVAGGYQFRTRPHLSKWVSRLEVPKPVRFTRPALETLAVIAYRQPITRAEVEEVRGVDCGGVLKTLLERGLLRIVGKKDVAGRPLLYGTARKFLETFSLSSLRELPSLRDLEEIIAAQAEEVSSESGAEEEKGEETEHAT